MIKTLFYLRVFGLFSLIIICQRAVISAFNRRRILSLLQNAEPNKSNRAAHAPANEKPIKYIVNDPYQVGLKRYGQRVNKYLPDRCELLNRDLKYTLCGDHKNVFLYLHVLYLFILLCVAL